jgi:queuine tRNA-ribosyltransferase
LITLHNLHFYLDLMRQARAKIDNGTFDKFRNDFVNNYKTRDVVETL